MRLSAQSCGVRSGGVVSASGDETGDVVEGMDASASAYSSAVESSGGTGEFELPVERPVLQHGVDEACVEDVARARSVANRYAEGGDVEELLAVPRENAFLAERCGGEAAGVTALHLAESLLEIGFGHETRGKVAADDEVVDVDEKILDVGVELVEVGYDGNVRLASPGGGEDGSLGVEAVDVESAGVGDPFALEIGGAEGESFVATGEDGALAGGIDKDKGLLADATRSRDEMKLNTGTGEGFTMESGCGVVANFSDVAGGHAPVLAGYDSGGNLSAGENCGGRVFDLGTACGIGGEGDDRVCCV